MAQKYLDDTGLSYFWGKIKDYFQVKLVSGTNIKTINNNSLLGSGDMALGETTASDTTGYSVNGNLLMVWGQNNITTGATASSGLYHGSVAITFSSVTGGNATFAHKPQVLLTWAGNYVNQNSLAVSDKSVDGFTAHGRTTTASSTRSIGWLAIGDKA